MVAVMVEERGRERGWGNEGKKSGVVLKSVRTRTCRPC